MSQIRTRKSRGRPAAASREDVLDAGLLPLPARPARRRPGDRGRAGRRPGDDLPLVRLAGEADRRGDHPRHRARPRRGPLRPRRQGRPGPARHLRSLQPCSRGRPGPARVRRAGARCRPAHHRLGRGTGAAADGGADRGTDHRGGRCRHLRAARRACPPSATPSCGSPRRSSSTTLSPASVATSIGYARSRRRCSASGHSRRNSRFARRNLLITGEGFRLGCPDEQHRGGRDRRWSGRRPRERFRSRMALPLGGPPCPARDLPAGNGGRHRPGRPPLLTGLDLRLDRRPDAGVLDRGRPALGPPPDQGLAADHRRAARLRPVARRRRRQPLRDPLGIAGARRQGARARAGPDHPAPGRALYPGPPALLGLRGVLVLVLPLLRHAAGGRRDLALPLSVVPPLRGLHRGARRDRPGHLRGLPGRAALAGRRPRLPAAHLSGSPTPW